MEVYWMVLELLKILLSTQVIASFTVIVVLCTFRKDIKSLILRIAKGRVPGGSDLHATQFEKLTTEKNIKDKILPDPQSKDLQTNLQEVRVESLKNMYTAERSRAYYWEYSYLNLFLTPTTQRTLDWLSSCKAPVSLPLYNTFIMPVAAEPKERKAMLYVLERHCLIAIKNSFITLTPKGNEYMEWRDSILSDPSGCS